MNHASSPLSLTLAVLILNIMVNSCLFRINFLFVFFTIFFLGKKNILKSVSEAFYQIKGSEVYGHALSR